MPASSSAFARVESTALLALEASSVMVTVPEALRLRVRATSPEAPTCVLKVSSDRSATMKVSGPKPPIRKPATETACLAGS